MDGRASSFATDSSPGRAGFWRMQAVFGKLRKSDAPAPAPPSDVHQATEVRGRRAVTRGAVRSVPVAFGERPAWLGSGSASERTGIKRCAWAMPPVEADERCAEQAVERCYEILGVSRDAAAEQLRQRFRQLAKRHHPDHGGDPHRFALLSMAYREVLRLTETSSLGASSVP